MSTERRALMKIFAAGAGTAALAPFLATNVHPDPGTPAIPDFPWAYRKLDPEAVAERAYPSHYQGGCCYGAFEGIVGELKQTAGYPYTLIPTQMMIFGEGGVAGTSTVCGALNGAAAAMFLATGALDQKKRGEAFEMIRELFGWYEQEALPDYRPRNAKYEIKPSVSRSPLCHASVTLWCKASGAKSFSKERAERCAWLAASTARHAVHLLNLKADGAFKPAHLVPSDVRACRGCHDKGSALENSRTTMDCGGCHFTEKAAKHS